MEISIDKTKRQPPELAIGAVEGGKAMLALVSLAIAIPARCCEQRISGLRSSGQKFVFVD